MSKPKTNDQMLIELIKTNSPMQNAMLRERIVTIMDLTTKDIMNNPDKWNNGFIHPSLYTELGNNVSKIIGFNN